MIILLLKVTLAAALALALEPLLRRRGAAIRHLLCSTAVAALLLIPVTLAIGPAATPIPTPVVIRLAVTAASRASRAPDWLRVFETVWACGSLLLLVRLALGHFAAARLAANASPAAGFPGTVPVFTADIAAPVVTGLLRPRILFPRAAAHWPEAHRAAALRHELAHVERLDLWTGLLARLACAVYWFHPLVWTLARRMRTLQELACDDAVLSSGFQPVVYAEALVAVAQQFTSTSLIGCHMITKNTLKARIARLVEGNLPRLDSRSTLRRAALVFTAVGVCIGLANAGPQTPPPAASAASASAPSGEKTYKMSEGITAPKVIYKVDPGYTEEARAAKISGSVRLGVVIGSDGKAHDITVLDTPDAGLGLKAIEAVQQWQFQPGTKDGRPVNVQASIEVNFKLL